MQFENKSTEFKRALHALSYALSLSQNIEDEDERELFIELLDEVGFSGNEDALLESIDKKFNDYDDYQQLQRGHFTGVWFQQMKKENGDIFLRDIIGNELTMPRPLSSFVGLNEDNKITEDYTAKQVSCFFVPFNTPSEINDVFIDETNHISLSLEQIKHGGTHNQIALDAIEYAKKIYTASTAESLK